MHKTLAIVEHEPELKAHVENLESIVTQQNEKLAFIRKQIDDLHQEGMSLSKPIWDEIKQYLFKTKRLPPDYASDKYSFHWDKADGILFLCDGDHNHGEELIARILGV